MSDPAQNPRETPTWISHPSFVHSETTSVPWWRWLRSTRQLQKDHFGVNYSELRGEKLADYMRTQIAAIASELGEFTAEVDWKPWVNADRERGWINRDQAVGELVDLVHFVANALCAMDVTDDEWEDRYRQKQEINRERRATGYDARSTKCRCGRAVEDGETISQYLGQYRCICGQVNSLS